MSNISKSSTNNLACARAHSPCASRQYAQDTAGRCVRVVKASDQLEVSLVARDGFRIEVPLIDGHDPAASEVVQELLQQGYVLNYRRIARVYASGEKPYWARTEWQTSEEAAWAAPFNACSR